jgi:hypothetical protein
MFVRHVSFAPIIGKESELRAHLERRVTTMQASGIAVSLTQKLFDPTGPVFVVVFRHEDVGEYVGRRREHEADSAYQAEMARASELIRSPIRNELFEVLLEEPA